MRLARAGDDVARALGDDCASLRVLGLGHEARARIGSAPGVERKRPDLAHARDQCLRKLRPRHFGPPGKQVESRLEVREERRRLGRTEETGERYDRRERTYWMADGIRFLEAQVFVVPGVRSLGAVAVADVDTD